MEGRKEEKKEGARLIAGLDGENTPPVLPHSLVH